MWVVWNKQTGWSDESMRFADRGDAELWINEALAAGGDELGDDYGIRWED